MSVSGISTNSYGHFVHTKPVGPATEPASVINTTNLDTLNPLDASQHGPISQLIWNSYYTEYKRGVKVSLSGSKLEAFLKRDYTEPEFKALPISAQNLIRFNKLIRSSEVIKFIEFWDRKHEIVFKDYFFENNKFKGLFAALGDLYDLQMQVGINSYMSLSKNFELRQKIELIFAKFKDKFSFLAVKKYQKSKARTKTLKVNEDDEQPRIKRKYQRRKSREST